jgi:hypothetical protein
MKALLVFSVLASAFTDSEITQRLKNLDSLQLWPMGYEECLEAFGPFSAAAPHKTRHQALLLACIGEAVQFGISKEEFCQDLEYWKQLVRDQFETMWDQYRRIEGQPGREEVKFRYLNTGSAGNATLEFM